MLLVRIVDGSGERHVVSERGDRHPIGKATHVVVTVSGSHAMLRTLLENVAVDALTLHTVMHLLAMHLVLSVHASAILLLLQSVHRSAWVVHLAELARLAQVRLRHMTTHARMMSVSVPWTETLVSKIHIHELLLLRVRLVSITISAVLVNTIGVRELHLFTLQLRLDTFAVGCVANEWQNRANPFDKHCSLSRIRIVESGLN